MEIHIILLLILTGSCAGFLAGLLGLGGGIIVIPITLWVLELQGLHADNTHHIAIGTSFGVMMFTTLTSVWAQHKRKAIIWSIVKLIVVGTAIGTLIGSTIASYISGKNLQILFVLFCYIIAARTFLQKQPQAATTIPTTLPKPAVLSGAGFGMGVISSLLGIGGGVMNVPFLLFYNVPMKNAVGISSAISFCVSIFGFVSYVYFGLSDNNLPPYSLGYCNVPIMACLAVATIIFAPLGVKMAHKLPAPILKKIFATLVLVVGTKILWSWLNM